MKNFKRLSILAIMSLLVISCCDCPQGDPVNIITEAEAVTMENTYLENQHIFINQGVEAQYQNGEPDNLGALIADIEDFQKYINVVKEEAEAQGYAQPALKVVYGAVNDANGVPRTIPFFMAIVPDTNGEDPDFPYLGDYLKLDFPQTFYDKLDPLNKDPKTGRGGDGDNGGGNGGSQ